MIYVGNNAEIADPFLGEVLEAETSGQSLHDSGSKHAADGGLAVGLYIIVSLLNFNYGSNHLNIGTHYQIILSFIISIQLPRLLQLAILVGRLPVMLLGPTSFLCLLRRFPHLPRTLDRSLRCLLSQMRRFLFLLLSASWRRFRFGAFSPQPVSFSSSISASSSSPCP